MRIFRHYEAVPTEFQGAVVAIGNFDGVHRGHHQVIDEAGRIASACGAPWAVLSFEPHPRLLFDSEAEPFRLTPFRTKARHIEDIGADAMIVLHFDVEFSQLSADDFINKVIINGLAARHVVSGYDFVFGYKRKGDCELLLHVGKREGFGYTCVSAGLDQGGEPFSSSRVRQMLRQGNPLAAAAVLGRYFEIEGRVESGDGRGKTIGYPTANIHLGEYLHPATGVYAVRAGIDRGSETVWHDGVANFGNRPTFAGDDVILEVYLFDFNDNLYGRHLRVALIDFIRREKKFDDIDDLKAQIALDCRHARHILDNQPIK